MQKVLTDKANYLIFLEEHTKKDNLTKIIKLQLNLEGKLAVLTENRPYSKQNKLLQEYAKALRRGEKVGKKGLIKSAEKTQDYFKHCFKRQLELIEYASKTGKEFKVIPLDIRKSHKIYEQFKKQDTLFSKLIKEAPELEKKEIDFFEEHAFGAWYTRKKIGGLLEKGFESFVYSVGYEHHPSIEHYLKDLFQRTDKSPNVTSIGVHGLPASLEYCLKELSQRTSKTLKFVFDPEQDFSSYYHRMEAFFLPEFRQKYCLHCGKECC